MHNIEPFYNWQHIYNSELDERSVFYGTEHSEFEYSSTIYNFYVHPQWDNIGNENLYLKVLFADYEDGFAIIEFLGEWNDVLDNDSAILKRNLVDGLIAQGIYKYILIAENVLSLFAGDTEYYAEWHEEVSEESGFIVMLNLNELCHAEWQQSRIGRYVRRAELLNWRTLSPDEVLDRVTQKLL